MAKKTPTLLLDGIQFFILHGPAGPPYLSFQERDICPYFIGCRTVEPGALPVFNQNNHPPILNGHNESFYDRSKAVFYFFL